MILIAHPRSGSSWLSRVLCRSLDLYLVNRNMSGDLSDGSLGRNMHAYHAAQRRPVSLLVRQHVESPELLKTYGVDVDGKRLHLYRDPRDVMVSYFYFNAYRARRRKQWQPRNVAIELVDAMMGRRYWRPNMFRLASPSEYDMLSAFIREFLPPWCQQVRTWLGEEVISIRYEELTEQPYETCAAAIVELGLEVDESKLREAISEYSKDKFARVLGDQTKPWKERMVRTGGPGGWKEHLDSEHLQLINELAGELLIELGYEEDVTWAASEPD